MSSWRPRPAGSRSPPHVGFLILTPSFVASLPRADRKDAHHARSRSPCRANLGSSHGAVSSARPLSRLSGDRRRTVFGGTFESGPYEPAAARRNGAGSELQAIDPVLHLPPPQC